MILTKNTKRTKQPLQVVALRTNTAFKHAIVANRGVNVFSVPSYGVTANAGGSANIIALPGATTHALNITKTASWSILFSGALISKSGNYPYFIGCTGATNAFALALNHGSFSGRATFYDGVEVKDSGIALALGEYATIGLTFDSVTGTLKWYKNGLAALTQTGVANVGGSAWQYASASSEGNTTHNNLLAFAQAVVPDALMLELTANPWQVFQPRTSFIPIVAAGGATHTTTGAITGQGATVAGTSAHLELHTTSGAITGQGATVAGVAVHPHTTTGVITGQGATLSGVSEHTASGHATSGAIVGQGATVAGVSTHLSLHTTTGAITGQGATVAGTSTHLSLHTTTGAITGQGATVAGVAVNGFPTSIVEQFSGGYEYAKLGNKRRTKDDIAKARKEYGLAFDVIEKVAIRQSKQLLTDEQKIYDELSRELTLKGLEIESKHIELLNLKKEKLVNDEIAMLLKKQEKEDKQVLAMMVEIVEQDKQNFINKMIELQHKFTAAIGV